MKNILFALLLIIYSGSSYANTDKAIQYYKLINEAEKYLSEKDYNNVQYTYQNAFSIFEIPLAKDLHKAMMNATALKDKFHFFQYAEMLSKNYGAPVEFYTMQEAFQVWKGTQKWQELLIQVKQNQTVFLNKNKIIIQQIDSLHTAVRNYYNHFFDNTYSEESLNKKVKMISNAILQLFEQYGFVTEYHVGLNLKNDTIIVDSKIMEIMRFSSLYVHNGIVEEAIVLNYDPHVKKAFEEGKISMDDFYRLYSFIKR